MMTAEHSGPNRYSRRKCVAFIFCLLTKHRLKFVLIRTMRGTSCVIGLSRIFLYNACFCFQKGDKSPRQLKEKGVTEFVLNEIYFTTGYGILK